ncbi:MAG: hypothetical protein V4477_19010 [Pseudomonadota bacterium]
MTRLSEQARYQRSYRAEQKVLRKPSRDDVARVALHVMIADTLERKEDGEFAALCEALVTRLVDLGFDRGAAYCRVDDLVERYADGWAPQRKPHLTTPSTVGSSEI